MGLLPQAEMTFCLLNTLKLVIPTRLAPASVTRQVSGFTIDDNLWKKRYGLIYLLFDFENHLNYSKFIFLKFKHLFNHSLLLFFFILIFLISLNKNLKSKLIFLFVLTIDSFNSILSISIATIFILFFFPKFSFIYFGVNL